MLLYSLSNGGNRPSQYGGFVGSNPTVYTIFNTGTERQVMNKAIVVVSIVFGILVGTQVPTFVHSGEHEHQGGWSYTDPNARFNTSANLFRTSTVTWIPVDNLQATCEAESRKRGNKGFGYTLEACSFWKDNTCTIYTPKKASLHMLGHETLHCFQGSFH